MRTISSIIFTNYPKNINNNILSYKHNKNWLSINKLDLYNNVNKCRSSLISKNISNGDRVAYKGNNSVEWLSWNLATNSLGAVWVPMYNNQNINYCNYILNDCEPKILISDNVSTKYDSNTEIINNIIPEYNKQSSDKIKYEYNDISTLIYTSGTTGNPKGVMLSNDNIISNIEVIRDRFSFMPQTTSLNILPWAHIYSQTCELYYNLFYNNHIYISSGKDDFLKECREIKPDVLYIVPRILDLIKSKLEVLNNPLFKYFIPYILQYILGNKIIVIFTGGAKLDTSTKQFFYDNGISICEGYGCSETSPMVSVNYLNDNTSMDSIGKLLDNILVEIIDDEIQVSGPNIMKGYWNNKVDTDKVLITRDNKIWYKTGDSGEIDINGYLYYNGRISENYKLSNGKFVNTLYIESIIKEYINGTFIIFGDGEEYNSIISDENITNNTIKQINRCIDPYLHIKKIYILSPDDFTSFMTPKMSIKRKQLIDFVKNSNTINTKLLI